MTLSLIEFMKTAPEETLESIAKRYETNVLTVVNAMPEAILAGGEAFDTIWDEVCTWGEITFLVNNDDIILECKTELPSGFYRHGYFNLRGKKGLSGHLRIDNCHHIAFVEKKFMKMDTASIIFFNQQGHSMFKIFVGRDSHHNLLTEQMNAFHQLAKKVSQTV